MSADSRNEGLNKQQRERRRASLSYALALNSSKVCAVTGCTKPRPDMGAVLHLIKST
jgi:hypothetical protein